MRNHHMALGASRLGGQSCILRCSGHAHLSRRVSLHPNPHSGIDPHLLPSPRALYAFLTGIEDRKPARFYLAYAALALALLAKGLIAPVFFVAAVVPYLIVTGEWRRWRQFHLFTGLLLFLAIGAPWHILAGLRNPDHGNPVGNIPTPGHVHGFFYFYFINEHFLRFLGLRYPHDYNRQPWYVFWLGQLIWLFPWSLYLPVVLRRAWRNRHLFVFRPALRFDQHHPVS